MDLRMYHPQDTDGIVEHIRDMEGSGRALCGFTHYLYSSSGETITPEWAIQNIPDAAALGNICKRCARSAMIKLGEKYTG